MSNPEIANTILAQIKTLSPMALISWGYQAGSYSDNSITFKVKGRKSGFAWVNITLSGDDTYKVKVFKVRRVKWEIRETVVLEQSGIYFDSLVSVLDGAIEGREYNR